MGSNFIKNVTLKIMLATKRKHTMSFKIFLFFMIFPFICFAQLPLITDNTGTQGKGKGQIEISNGVGFHNGHRCIENFSEITPILTFGVLDQADIVVGYPFLFSSNHNDTSILILSGFSDLNIEFKYCFLQYKDISLAIKPGFSFPTGNYNEGLGSGRISESFFLLFTAKISSMLINGDLGYLRNENKCGDALNIWHASADIDYKISDEFHFVLNSGIEKNPDTSVKTNPVFGLLGLYYCIGNNCEVSLGYKHGFTKAETDHTFIYGLTLRF